MPVVECPDCGERFHVVLAEDVSEEQPTEQSSQMTAKLLSTERLDPKHPYPASDTNFQADRLKADIEINDERIDFEFFYVPCEENFDYFTHVVRANTDAGRKSKDVFTTEDDALYFKNRGVPWNEDKQWTYLSKEELERRSDMAGLGEVIDDPGGEGRYGVLLDAEDTPLVVDGEVQENLLLQMAKALLVFQSEKNPLRDK